MSVQDPELLEKIRQQFDFGPYPRIPVDQSPSESYNLLYKHCYATPHYLRYQEIAEPQSLTILDVGCGTGYKTLTLAEANPGCRIVGADISAESIRLAKERLSFHKIENAEFYVIDLDSLSDLGIQFDYINCDELLYLFPDISIALQSLKRVLKPRGFIRSNLHSSLQRASYFRAQEMFQMMGLMDGNPEEMEIDLSLEILKSLKDEVDLKRRVYPREDAFDGEDKIPQVLMNLLFQGDKGYTILDLFTALDKADLAFVSMVNWRQWELSDLFKEPDNLPAFLALGLEEADVATRLHLFELLQPIHRLLDFWCGHPDQSSFVQPVTEWTTAEWMLAKIHLHPQLRKEKIRKELEDCLKIQKAFCISQYLPETAGYPVYVEMPLATCLLPLWQGPQTFQSLVERWLKLRPLNLISMEPVQAEEAEREVMQMLQRLENFLYIFIEQEN